MLENPLTLKIQLGQMGHKPWDPNASAQVRFNFNNAVYEKPFHFTNKYEILPGYIIKWRWDYSSDQYILTLADLKFHNGRAITARDLEYTIIRPFISKLNRTERQLLNEISGLKEIKPGDIFKTGMVSGIKVLDDKTLSLKLVKPNAFFLYSFGENLPPLVPQEELKEDHYTFKGLPVGCGKYKVVWSDPSSSLVKLARLTPPTHNQPEIIEIFNHGDAISNGVDLAVGAGSSAIESSDTNFKWVKSEVPIAVQVIDFNFQNLAIQDPNFRKMLQISIDKETLVKPYLKLATLTEQLIPSNLAARTQITSAYNVKEAKKIFDQLPKSIRNKTFVIFFHGSLKVPKYVTTLLEDWKKIGLKVEAKGTDVIDFELKHKEAFAYTYGRVTSFADPLKIFSFYLPDAPNKFNSPKDDSKFLALYDAANSMESAEKRIEKIKEISQYFRDEIRQIPLFENFENFTYRKNVKSIGIDNIYTSLNYELVEMLPDSEGLSKGKRL